MDDSITKRNHKSFAFNILALYEAEK